MPTALESKQALVAVAGRAVDLSTRILDTVTGSPVEVRAQLVEAVPELVGYFTDGTAALAADFYDDERDRANAPGRYFAEPIVLDRTVKLRRATAWASEPLFDEDTVLAGKRLAEVVQLEVARPYRDTITHNRKADPEAVGWRRVTTGGCRFCRMLADRGAVYRAETVRFAAHEHCGCSAAPVFTSNDTGETASVMQYVASKRHRTPAEKAALRDYLATYY